MEIIRNTDVRIPREVYETMMEWYNMGEEVIDKINDPAAIALLLENANEMKEITEESQRLLVATRDSIRDWQNS